VGAAVPSQPRKAGTVNFAEPTQGGGSGYTLIIMMVLLFGAMYFLMIRPQQKRRRAMEAMQSSISPGDEVITIGGLYGTVIEIDDETVTLEVSPGVTNRFARGAISRVTTAAATEADGDDEADEAEEAEIETVDETAKTTNRVKRD
jgi:preprotein translocase subunit YajC